MLTFCRRNRKQIGAVVVYNLNRFARNAGDHHAVRGIFRSLGITLRSVTEHIDDSPGGKMVEGILATVHQFEERPAVRTHPRRHARGCRARSVVLAGSSRPRQSPVPGDRGEEHRTGPRAGPFVRRAFEEVASCVYTGHTAFDRVNELGLTTRRGKPVSRQT